jgi:integrase
MSVLAQRVEEYLSLRRRLGFKLVFPGRVLPLLAAFIEASGSETMTAELAIAWAGLPGDSVAPISLAHRLGAARGFARWLQTIDPSTEIPPAGIWPSTAPRPTPYLWTEGEIEALLDATRQLHPPLRAATHGALFGLLAATGMRIGETIALERADVDLASGLITIRRAKLGRSRLVPLHPSTTEALAAYAARRDRLCRTTRSPRFFVSSVGTALDYGGVHRTFVELSTAIGLRTESCRPRIHDLRHSFTVRTLLDWHRNGADVAARMPVLSTYLGHLNPAGTFWYVSAAPELMELVASRLQNAAGSRR